VFVDPVSTGLSLPEKGEDPKQFHGFNEDIESVGEFVRLWVTKHNRWGSPKFLMGESYGAIRVSGLASHLQDKFGMYLNGIIIVSGLLDFKTLSPDDQNDVPFIAWLPCYAAAAHYHKKLAPELMQDFQGLWDRVREFSRGAYSHALLRGASLPAEDRERIAGELSTLTSLPKDWILRRNLRIDPSAFRQKLLEAEDKVIGRFDARCTGVAGDPSYTVVYGAFATLMNSYLRDKDGLNYQTERPYEILNSGAVSPWNYGRGNRYFDVCGELVRAITDNPALHVFIACGYHDLATPAEGIEHSVRHMDLPPDLRGNIHWGYYDGGHMMYTLLPSLKKLSADVSAFLRQAAK
jgi:carboxypeptidase C (cathepsin A)